MASGQPNSICACVPKHSGQPQPLVAEQLEMDDHGHSTDDSNIVGTVVLLASKLLVSWGGTPSI